LNKQLNKKKAILHLTTTCCPRAVKPNYLRGVNQCGQYEHYRKVQCDLFTGRGMRTILQTNKQSNNVTLVNDKGNAGNNIVHWIWLTLALHGHVIRYTLVL
jgi:hypothetical protein